MRGASALDAETVPVGDAHHRVLARPVISGRTTPAADVSAMDGYAVRAADVATVPVTLTLAGEAAAGRPHDGTLQPGETVRVFTGGVMPAGADAVVIQEDTRREGERVTMLEATTPGRHVRRAGGDFAKGDIVLAGRAPAHRPRPCARRRRRPCQSSKWCAARASASSPPATNWCRLAPAPARTR